MTLQSPLKGCLAIVLTGIPNPMKSRDFEGLTAAHINTHDYHACKEEEEEDKAVSTLDMD